MNRWRVVPRPLAFPRASYPKYVTLTRVRGVVALDASCREALMEIIDDRACNRATLITSQLPVDHWHAWIDEPAVADAMLDRLLPQAQRIVLKGDSLRAARTKKTPSSANQS